MGLVRLVLSRRWSQLAKSFGELSVSVIDSGLGLYRAPGQASLHEVGDRPLSVQPLTTQYHEYISANHFTCHQVSRRNRTLLSLAIFLGVLGWNVAAAAVKGETGVPVAKLSAHEIEEQLQVRQPLAFLN